MPSWRSQPRSRLCTCHETRCVQLIEPPPPHPPTHTHHHHHPFTHPPTPTHPHPPPTHPHKRTTQTHLTNRPHKHTTQTPNTNTKHQTPHHTQQPTHTTTTCNISRLQTVPRIDGVQDRDQTCPHRIRPGLPSFVIFRTFLQKKSVHAGLFMNECDSIGTLAEVKNTPKCKTYDESGARRFWCTFGATKTRSSTKDIIHLYHYG